jgi:hypothetical protein
LPCRLAQLLLCLLGRLTQRLGNRAALLGGEVFDLCCYVPLRRRGRQQGRYEPSCPEGDEAGGQRVSFVGRRAICGAELAASAAEEAAEATLSVPSEAVELTRATTSWPSSATVSSSPQTPSTA